MIPAARVQAAIEILDEILAGAPVEKALTGWARRSRFAGSKDRAAIRDHVFDALRCKRSFAALGGSETGRGLMIGQVRSTEADLDQIFTGRRHAPAPIATGEIRRDFASAAERCDIPDWLWPEFKQSLGDEAEAAAIALQSRAPVHLRVNLAKSDVVTALSVLERDGVVAEQHPACATALFIRDGARKVSHSTAYQQGLVELQDAASQAVVTKLPLRPGMRVLDYCAGGGGKALAMAAHEGIQVYAHDANPSRMRDLPARAKRAGVDIAIVPPEDIQNAPEFDLVLTDVPCSGSGSWRRAPAGKWALTQQRLRDLSATQLSILTTASGLVRHEGVLAYVTCSMLKVENEQIVGRFLASQPDWRSGFQKTWLVTHGTDGFFTTHLTRS